jgi:hypothetical protein
MPDLHEQKKKHFLLWEKDGKILTARPRFKKTGTVFLMFV